MPMAMENLTIAQHRDILQYATIQGGSYRLQVRKFELGHHVYLQQISPTTLDVIAGHVILRVWKVLLSRILLLEG
jgi:hypothetical protein